MSPRKEGRDGGGGAGRGDRRRSAPRAALAWGFSILAHAIVIGLMVLVVRVVVPSPDDGPVVTVSFDDPGLLRTSEPATAEPAPKPATPAPEIPEPPPVEPVAAPEIAPPDAAPAPLRPRPRVAPEVALSPPPEVKFVGLGAGSARDIVYVVDGSGSMISAMPIVLKELERSLRKLEPMQRFQIVFFQNDGFVAMPLGRGGAGGVEERTRLIRAKSAAVDAALAWASGTRPSGRSDPLAALEAALKLKPDAVFLLTTEITGSSRWSEQEKAAFFDRLEAMDPARRDGDGRRVPIKTILFLDEDASGIVPEIGGRFGGENGFVFRSRADLGL